MRRDRRHPPRPRREHPPLRHAAEAVGATRPVGRLRPRTGELSSWASRSPDQSGPGWSPSPARPTCWVPARTSARDRGGGAPGRRPGLRRRRASDPARRGRRGRARARTCSPARPTSFRPAPRRARRRPRAARPLRPDKLLPSSDAVPERFELGTLPYELLAGTTARSSSSPAWRRVGVARERVVGSMTRGGGARDGAVRAARGRAGRTGGVTVHGTQERTPTALVLRRRPPGGATSCSAARGVNAPAGSFYAIEASRWFGLGDDGAVRAGLAPYTNDDDVARLLDGVAGLTAG